MGIPFPMLPLDMEEFEVARAKLDRKALAHLEWGSLPVWRVS